MAERYKYMDIEKNDYGTIDAKQLVEQSGSNVGNTTADEFSPGQIKTVAEKTAPKSDVRYITESHPMVEGLPLMGADEENKARDNVNFLPQTSIESAAENRGISTDELKRQEYDRAGMDAMLAEISRRAEALAPNASTELRDAIKEQVLENFKSELESKRAERQAQFDAKATEILEKLKSGTPLSEVIPNYSSPLLGTEMGDSAPTS